MANNTMISSPAGPCAVHETSESRWPVEELNLHIHRGQIIVMLGALLLGNASPAATDIAHEKAHIVSRVYQATYEAEIQCRSVGDPSGLNQATAEFRRAFPEFMAMIDTSPYLSRAKDQSDKFLANQTGKLSNEELMRDCAGIAFLLRQFIDHPSGRLGIQDMMNKLKE